MTWSQFTNEMCAAPRTALNRRVVRLWFSLVLGAVFARTAAEAFAPAELLSSNHFAWILIAAAMPFSATVQKGKETKTAGFLALGATIALMELYETVRLVVMTAS